LNGDRSPGLEGHVICLSGNHELGGPDQAAGGPYPLRRRLVEHYLQSERGESITDDDGRPGTELGPHGRSMSAFGVAIDDVVVDEGEVVDQLDGDGAGHPDLLCRARRGGRDQGKCSAHALSSAGQVMLYRNLQGRAEPLDGFVKGGSYHEGGAGQSGRRYVIGVGGHAATLSSCRVERSASSVIAWAALSPLSTAPSMVAGHPVSHHAPARRRPGSEGRERGRRAAVPGVARNVAARSRVTTPSMSRAVRATGRSAWSAAKNVPTSCDDDWAM